MRCRSGWECFIFFHLIEATLERISGGEQSDGSANPRVLLIQKRILPYLHTEEQRYCHIQIEGQLSAGSETSPPALYDNFIRFLTLSHTTLKHRMFKTVIWHRLDSVKIQMNPSNTLKCCALSLQVQSLFGNIQVIQEMTWTCACHGSSQAISPSSCTPHSCWPGL